MPKYLSIIFFLIVNLFVFSNASEQISSNPKNSGSSERGKAVYEAQCAACHGFKLEGGQFAPQLKGLDFQSKWLTQHPEKLLSFISKKMPPAQPGSLAAGEYLDISELITVVNEEMLPDESKAGHVGVIPAAEHVFHDSFFHQITTKRQALLQEMTPVSDEQLWKSKTGDWLTWRGGHRTQSYSPLSEINKESVDKLSVAWAWSLPVGTNEIAPLVHDGVIFIQSSNEVQALDALGGDLLWRYVRDLEPKYRGSINSLHRSISIYGNNIYISTADRHVVALNAKTGKLVWEQPIVSPETEGVILSSGPLAVRGKIIQGTSMGLYCKGGCSIVGLDAKTGEKLWEIGTIAKPDEFGGDTWNNTPLEQRTGGASWIPGSYNPRTNLVYMGTSGTYDIGSIFPLRVDQFSGSNKALYTNSTLAINPDTGRIKWFHQHFPAEMWDLDEAFERSLIDLEVDGVKRSLVVSIGKVGIIDALDAETGEFIFAKDLGLQNIVSKIDPSSGHRSINPDLNPTAGEFQSICPSPEGVRNWLTTAYNPQDQVLFIPMGETCMDYIWQPNSNLTSGIDIGWSVKPRPGSDGYYGRIEAVDLLSRKTLWVKRQRSPLSSSLLSTAGGLVFAGDRKRMFRAINDQTGESLWSVRLNAVPNSSPITYSVEGKQFIAVAAGGGGLHDVESVEITPEIHDAYPSTTLWVFALPDEPK
jgi:alcohol dehydrogenase (cytochrome c)